MKLIGRQSERRQARELFLAAGVLTITGAGGIGKTALVAAMIDDLQEESGRRPVLVDLAAIDHPDGVRELIASQLGSTDYQALLRSSLCDDRVVVLDNCEHVLDNAASVVDELLSMAAPPKILATSRAPLGIGGELILPLSPLSLPPEFPITTVEREASDALRLLIERARGQGVLLGAGDFAAAGSICRQLDGVPLAIEIAAARLRSRSTAELRDELQVQAHRLARPRFRGEPRQRSVREMVLWSVDLLAPDIADFFVSLSVFAGPFTVGMAVKLTDADIDTAADYLDELVADSLITADTTAATTWFRLLRPVRSVMEHERVSSNRFDGAQSRWVDVVIALTFETIATEPGGWTQRSLGSLLALYPNITAALRWLIEHEPPSDQRTFKLLSALWGVVHQRHASEIATLGQMLLDRGGPAHGKYWTSAVATVATCWNLLGEHARAVELAQEAFVDGSPPSFGNVALLRVTALAARAQGDLARAQSIFARASKLAHAGELRGLELELRCDGGYMTGRLGDLDGGLNVIASARSEAIDNGASVNATWALVCRGMLEVEHDPADAIRTLQEALAEARQIGYQAGVCVALRGTALAQEKLGQDHAAALSLSSLLGHFAGRGEVGDLRMALDLAAGLAERAGRAEWADLATTAAQLPVTSASVDPHLPIFGRAAGAGGRVLDTMDAFAVCRRVLDEIEDGGRDTVGDAGPRVAVAGELLRSGDSWHLRFGEERGIVRDSKGIRDIAHLIGEPGREVASFDLMGSVVVDSPGQSMIDQQARRELEARIRELHEDIEEAHQNNDQTRTSLLEEELGNLVDYLSAAMGLHGKHRTVSASAERARSAVTHRIRAVIRKLEPTHPRLAAHFRASVRTGSFCSYEPPATTTWTVRW